MNVERAEPGTPQWAELAAPHLARYLFAAERVAGRRVLDLGSGAGYGAAAQARRDAVTALRTGLMASNPLFVWAWRKWPCMRRDDRGWARLAGLAAPSIGDFPIVPAAVADVHGSPRFTVAICRQPIAAESA